VRIDLNADLGEGLGDDAALLHLVTSANVATGAHAGGGSMLTTTVVAAAAAGVAIGAHPSYRDRPGFGRASQLALFRDDAAARHDLVVDLVGQVLLVAEAAEREGSRLAHVKAHGALYNDAVADPVAAQLLVDVLDLSARACGHDLALLTQPGGQLDAAARAAGITVVGEGFADRGYLASGRLVPRSEPGALHDGVGAMVRQALDLASGWVVARDGTRVRVPVGSLCVHGDTPDSVRVAAEIRSALERAGWVIAAPTAAGA
jgi:UPF0271 protein